MTAVNRKIAQHAIKAQANLYDAIDQLREIVRLAEMDAHHEFKEHVHGLGMDIGSTLAMIDRAVKDHIEKTED